MNEYTTLRKAIRELSESLVVVFELDRLTDWTLRTLANLAGWILVIVIWLKKWEGE